MSAKAATEVSVSRGAQRLKPWLELANLVEISGHIRADRRPLFLRNVNVEGLPDFPNNIDPVALENFEIEMQKLLSRYRSYQGFPTGRIRTLLGEKRDGRRRVYELGFNVRNTLVAATRWDPSLGLGISLTAMPIEGLTWIGVSIDHVGRLRTRSDNLFADEFLKTIDGIEPRIRRCPVCPSLFYAVRKDKPACSQRCGHILRTRLWHKRRERYEYKRKLRGAGL